MEKVFNHLETLTFQTTNQNKNNFCRDFLFFQLNENIENTQKLYDKQTLW